MADARDPGPFNADIQELHLNAAPLVRVLAQVRWDELTQFNDGFIDKVGELARLLEKDYPIAQKMQGTQISVGPLGVSQQQGPAIHTLSSSNDAWKIYFAPTQVTLETQRYTSREDFCARLLTVLEALSTIATIPRAIRTGFRYVNRVDETNGFDQIGELVRPELLGGTAYSGLDSVVVRHSIAETYYATARGDLLTRSAVLPAGGFLDPTIAPVESKCWMLDLDAFSEAKSDFAPVALVQRISALSELGYGFFRWAVLPAFIERYSEGTEV